MKFPVRTPNNHTWINVTTVLGWAHDSTAYAFAVIIALLLIGIDLIGTPAKLTNSDKCRERKRNSRQ